MTVYLNAVSVQSAIPGTPTAPLIEGSAAAVLETSNQNFVNSTYFNFGSDLIGRYGMRVALPTALDFTGHTFVTFAVGNTQYSPGGDLDAVANGGMRIYFVDGAGSYAGFNIYGALPLYNAEGAIDGFLASYNSNNIVFSIALARTPDVSGGSVDWSDITHIEVTAKTVANSRKDCHLSRLVKRSVPYFTGTETLQSLNDAGYAVRFSSIGDPMLMRAAPMYLKAAAQTNFNLRLGLQVGDGSTTTAFSESNFAIGFENLYEYSPGAPSHGPWVQLDDAQTRPMAIVQSASDVLTLTDGSISSAGGWQWELSGSGVATCTRVQFWRFNGFRAAHGSYIDCAWNEGESGVEVTLNSTVSGGLVRGSTATALKIIDGAGDYSGLQLEIDSPDATYDIELGAGGAGTYELPNITVPAGYTLRVRNDSATNAVVVQLPLGLAYTTSTAGGPITVEVPEVSVTIEAPALIEGSRVQLYNVTDGFEMLNTELPGAGLSYSVLYSASKVIRLRADHATKLPLETAGVLTASGLTFLDVQVEDEVYLAYGIDGSTVTEFSPDGVNLEVDIDDPDGVTHIDRIYAWLQWYMTTEVGVASAFFGAVTAIDSANIQIDQAKADIKLDNVSAMPVRVIGGNLTRRDGSTVIAATSGSIQMDPGKAYIVETGVSGLTTDESDKLNRVSLLALETTATVAATAASVAADNTIALLDQPVPTAGAVAAAVWADPAADGLALESTAQEALAQATIAAGNVAPSASTITAAVWADPAASALALEVTAQLAADSSALAAERAGELLGRDLPPTAEEVKTAVWSDPSALALAKETTAQEAVNQAALAVAVSA